MRVLVACSDGGAMGMKLAKQRKCRCGCGQTLIPRNSLHVAATPECAIRIANKAQEKREKAARKETRARLNAMKPLRKLTAEAQAAFNAYIRVRDSGLPCISCGRMALSDPLTGGVWDCGHYRSTGSAPHLRFDERNAHRQCKKCNRDLAGNVVEYRKGLVAKIGEAAVIELEHDNEPRRYRASDLIQIKETYRRKLRELSSKD